MPMEARTRAEAPKMERSSMLKLCRAVELTTTSSIERARATGNPPLAWRSCSLTAEMNWCGSVCVRTTQIPGSLRAFSAVTPSATWPEEVCLGDVDAVDLLRPAAGQVEAGT